MPPGEDINNYWLIGEAKVAEWHMELMECEQVIGDMEDPK